LSLLSFFPCIIGFAEEPYFITSHLDAIALGSSPKRCWWQSIKRLVILSFLPHSSSSIFAFATNITQRKTQVYLGAIMLSSSARNEQTGFPTYSGIAPFR